MKFENNVAVIVWFEDGELKMRIGCKKHMSVAVQALVSGGKENPRLALVCDTSGCYIGGDWENRYEMNADIEELRELAKKSAYVPPQKKT